MKQAKVFILILVIAVFIGLNSGLSLGQDLKAPEKTQALNDPDVQWLWGEVVSVDLNAKQITVKYLDYDTYQDKESAINVDEQTTYENLTSLEEIKPQDTISVDYIISLEGKNLARNISLEKPEEDLKAPQLETNEEPLKEAPAKDKE